jgi:hypothetical protein
MSMKKDLQELLSDGGTLDSGEFGSTFYRVTFDSGEFVNRSKVKSRMAQALAKVSRMFPADSKFRLKSPADTAEKYLGNAGWMRSRSGCTVSALCRDAVRDTFGEWAA